MSLYTLLTNVRHLIFTLLNKSLVATLIFFFQRENYLLKHRHKYLTPAGGDLFGALGIGMN